MHPATAATTQKTKRALSFETLVHTFIEGNIIKKNIPLMSRDM